MCNLCGPSQNTATSTSGPPPAFSQAYLDLIHSAQGIAGQPLQQYSGDIVAGLSPDQQAAIGSIQDSQGIGEPMFNEAADMYEQSAEPIQSHGLEIGSQYGEQLGGIADQYGTGAVDTAQRYGQGATDAAAHYGQAATGSAGAGINMARQGAAAGAGAATGAASTDVWGQLPSFQSGINQYMSPFLNDVVGSTMAQFQNQNAQEDERLKGNIISSGAFGGDRGEVARGIASSQRQIGQNAQIAQLLNQGFQQGTGQYNTDKSLQANLGQNRAGLMANTALGAGSLLSNTGTATGNLGANTNLSAGQLGTSANLGAGQLGTNAQLGAGQMGINAGAQAGQLALTGNQQDIQNGQANANRFATSAAGIANIGTQAQQAALQGAQAQWNVGQAEQNQQQQQLNVPYQQFLQQQQYPFQTAQWLGGLETGIGGAAGGQSSTTTPGPSTGSQILGTAASILPFFLRRGGRVPQRKRGGGTGGNIPGSDSAAGISSDVPDMSLSFIPELQMTHGNGPPKAPPPVKPKDDGMGDSIAGIVGALAGKGGSDDGIEPLSKREVESWGIPGSAGVSDDLDQLISSLNIGDIGAMMARGGGLRRRAVGGYTSPTRRSVDTSALGIAALPQRRTPVLSMPRSSVRGVDPGLTRNYGNAASDSAGNSVLPHTTYKPPVGAPSPFAGQSYVDDAGNSQIYVRRGGGIPRRAEGGIADEAPDDDEDYGDDDFDDDAPDTGGDQGGIAASAFHAHPIENQPHDTALGEDAGAPTKSGAAGIDDTDVSPDRYGVKLNRPNFAPTNDKADKKEALKMALLSAGMGILGSNRPGTFQNIGVGGQQGVKTYEQIRQQQAKQRQAQAQSEMNFDYRQGTLDQNARKFSDQVQTTRARIKNQGEHWQRQDENAAQRETDIANARGKHKWVPGGVDKDGNVVMVDQNSQGKTPTTYTVTGVKPKPSGAAGAQITLSKAALHDMVIRKLKGEKITDEIGNSAANKAAFLNELSEFTADPNNNVKPADVTAAMVDLTGDKAMARSLGSMQGRVESSVVEADKFADNALAQSEKVNRTQFVPVNVAVNAWKNNTGDPEIVAFGFMNNSLANAYATAVGKGTKTVQDTEEALKLLNTAHSKEQYAAAIRALKMETHAAQAAPDAVRQRMHHRLSGKNGLAETTDITSIAGEPNDASIALLKEHPDKAPAFDKKYGPGAAAKVLGTEP